MNSYYIAAASVRIAGVPNPLRGLTYFALMLGA